MKEKLEKQKGITLIALIISIIVMLILAAVSINIIINQGIITKSKTASDKYNQKAEEEQENLTSWEQLIEQYGGTDTAVPQELKAYLLGKDVNTVMNAENMTFKDNPDTIENESETIVFKDIMPTGSAFNNSYAIIQYKDLEYKIRVSYIKNEDIYKIDLIVLLNRELKGNEGKTVRYNGKEYTILYDNGDTVEMLSNNVMGSYKIGYDDPNATGNNNFEKTVNSYNNAIERLNKYCASLYEGDSNIISVRSVGSDPTNLNNENKTLYTSERISKSEYNCNGEKVRIDKLLKNADNNWESDLNKMAQLGIMQANSEDNTVSNATYWFASRGIEEDDYYTFFSLLICNERNELETFSIISAHEAYESGSSKNEASVLVSSGISKAVRPVVKIKTSALNLE